MHKIILAKDIKHKNILIETIDKTISHLKGKKIMTDKELYYGFDSSRQKEYEQYLVKYYGTNAEDLLITSKKHTAKWDKDEWDKVKNESNNIHKALSTLIEKGFNPEFDEVQEIIKNHYKMVKRFYHPTKEIYIGLTTLYKEHPDMRKFFDKYHPKMVEFIGKAMRFYANKNLS